MPEENVIEQLSLFNEFSKYKDVEELVNLRYARLPLLLFKLSHKGTLVLTLMRNYWKMRQREIASVQELEEWSKTDIPVVETARLASHVYGQETSSPLPEGWSVCTQFDSELKLNDEQTGLKSCVYHKTLKDGNKHYVYAIAGTKNKQDWIENGKQVIGQSVQYGLALENANFLVNKIDKERLTFVGHSLGGGEASYIATKIQGTHARTFNQAGVSSWTTEEVLKEQSQIDAYILKSDPLNFAQELLGEVPQTIGTRHYIKPAKKYSIMESHKMHSLIESLTI